MAYIKQFKARPEEHYKEIWDKYLFEFERDAEMTLLKFLRSNSVDMRGFKEWREYNGLVLPKRKHLARKKGGNEINNENNMRKEDANITLEKECKNMVLDNSSSSIPDAKQYWWLNADATFWELEKANKNETKTINCDIQFIEWISNYLNDKGHIGIPIAKRELAYSLLDYCGIVIGEKTVKAAMKRIRENLENYIRTSAYVMNPDCVLLTDTDRDLGFRRCFAWTHQKNPDGSLMTDENGNRLPRVLIKKAPYQAVYYFYRKGAVPKYKYDEAHIGDPDYVQPAPDVDIETGNHCPNISNTCPVLPVPSIKKGDSVIACMNNKIVAFIEVISENGKEVIFKITKKLPTPFLISSINTSDFNFIPEKNLGFFPITKSDFDCIIDKLMKYSKEDLLSEVYIDETTIDNIVRALNYKKNIILQGVPGVGKTFLAKKLAYVMMRHKDEERVCVVQFHPNYTYEDFIIGYKPCNDGKFKLKPGVFMEFCKKAAKDKDNKKYFFIIDEINRGNLSKIFGEAFTLIDKDHRGESIKLANSDEEYKEFEIPKNVYIIGLMNTADRSLAMLDIALQRRFEFLPLMPAFETKSFKKYMDSLKSDIFKEVINRIIKLNKEIEKEPALGEGYCIGHSYFCISKDREKEYKECMKDIKAWLKDVIHYEIIPILRSYCFDEKETFDRLSTPLLEVFK